jgi:hypothetical protein
MVCLAYHPMNENPKIAARKLQIIAGRLPSQLRQVIKNCQNYSGDGKGRGMKFVGGSTHSTKLANLPFDPTSYLKYLPHERNQHTLHLRKEGCLLACLLACMWCWGPGGRGERREFLDDFSQMNEHEHEQATHNAHAFDNESTHNQVCISHKLLNE